MTSAAEQIMDCAESRCVCAVPNFNEANKWRSLSFPVVTDKIVQQPATNLLPPVFEKEFLDCSFQMATAAWALFGNIRHKNETGFSAMFAMWKS